MDGEREEASESAKAKEGEEKPEGELLRREIKKAKEQGKEKKSQKEEKWSDRVRDAGQEEREGGQYG